jgi:outer membrane lipoprotein SlyB
MENKNTSNRLHPVVAGAAISVMLLSLTGIAAITGLLPNSHSTTALEAAAAPATITASPLASSLGSATAATSPAALVEPKNPTPPVAQAPGVETPAAPVPHRSSATRTAKPPHTQTQTRPSYEQNTVAQAPVCHTCGRVESVQTIQHAAKPSGLGVVAGGVLGGLLGNQVGNGNGRTLATVAGAVGGGYAGNEVEKRSRTTVTYQVRVHMDDGQIHTFPFTQQPGWGAGDRVRVVDGNLRAGV